MGIIWAKYARSNPFSKPVCCNSRKNATLQKPVFQIGLRLTNGAIIGEIICRECSGPKYLKKGMLDHSEGTMNGQ
jgi:hypothetical protein